MKEEIAKILETEAQRQGYNLRWDSPEPLFFENLENLKQGDLIVNFYENSVQSMTKYLIILECEKAGESSYWSLSGYSDSSGGNYVDLETLRSVKPVEKLQTVWENN